MGKRLSLVWQQRSQALDEAIELSQASCKNQTLKALLSSLQAFGNDQFQFFYNGFSNGRLLPSMYHPAEYVVSATLNQISYDLSVIQQATEQRNTPRFKEILDKADRLAQNALNLATDRGLLQPTAVVTYFNKSANIRVIPYAPVALIGVPFTSLTSNQDLLAIPHEVGHYVYNHATGLAANLHQQIPLDPPWFNRWIEEIFADIYGCLVAGPLIGLDFQDLLLDNPAENFTKDNGEHPIDALRPFIHITVLQQLGFPNAAAALKDRWEKVVQHRNCPGTFIPFNTDTPVSLADARTKLEAVTSNMLTYLLDTHYLRPDAYWSKDLKDTNDDVTRLYKAFDRWLKKYALTTVNQLEERDDKIGVLVRDNRAQNIRPIGTTQTWRDAMKQLVSTGRTVLPFAAWLPIFTSGFWPVKGPEGNGDSGI